MQADLWMRVANGLAPLIGGPAMWTLFSVTILFLLVRALKAIYELSRDYKKDKLDRVRIALEQIKLLDDSGLSDQQKDEVSKSLLLVSGISSEASNTTGSIARADYFLNTSRLNLRILSMAAVFGVLCEGFLLSYYKLTGWSVGFGPGAVIFGRQDGSGIVLQIYAVTTLVFVFLPFAVARLFFAHRSWRTHLAAIVAVDVVFCAITIIQIP